MMAASLTPTEMFNELVRRGFVTPASIDPAWWMMPTAYVSVPTATAFFSPPISAADQEPESDAKLGLRVEGNQKRNRRSRR